MLFWGWYLRRTCQPGGIARPDGRRKRFTPDRSKVGCGRRAILTRIIGSKILYRQHWAILIVERSERRRSVATGGRALKQPGNKAMGRAFRPRLICPNQTWAGSPRWYGAGPLALQSARLHPAHATLGPAAGGRSHDRPPNLAVRDDRRYLPEPEKENEKEKDWVQPKRTTFGPAAGSRSHDQSPNLAVGTTAATFLRYPRTWRSGLHLSASKLAAYGRPHDRPPSAPSAFDTH